MAYLVLSVLGLSEIGFLIYGIMKSARKRNWAIRRLTADAIQAVLFAVMLVLPGVDTSFRFKGLIFLLVIRIAVAGLLALINRKKVEMKKLGGKSPLETARFFYPDLYKKLTAFGICPVESDKIVLKPYLLKNSKR